MFYAVLKVNELRPDVSELEWQRMAAIIDDDIDDVKTTYMQVIMRILLFMRSKTCSIKESCCLTVFKSSSSLANTRICELS